MARRRWVWAGAAVLAALWLVQARAEETEAAAAPRSPEPAAPPRAASQPVASPSAAASSSPTATPARRGFGYAAESARTATRLSVEEREARAFLRGAALASRFELEATRLAATRASGERVRSHAADLLQYHEAAHVELLHLLHARGMAMPMMDTAQRKALQRLARLSGPKFDREYVELLGGRQQREELVAYEKAVGALGDPVLRAWAERQLPNLRSQHAAARRLSGTPSDHLKSASLAVRPTVARR